MKLLLDTHVFLWWDSQDRRLGPLASATIADVSNDVFVSAASIWEIAIKSRLGKLSITRPPTDAIVKNGFAAIPMLPSEAECAGFLVWNHNDPFDRMLVAQAMNRSMTLVTADNAVRGFGGISQLWAGA